VVLPSIDIVTDSRTESPDPVIRHLRRASGILADGPCSTNASCRFLETQPLNVVTASHTVKAVYTGPNISLCDCSVSTGDRLSLQRMLFPPAEIRQFSRFVKQFTPYCVLDHEHLRATAATITSKATRKGDDHVQMVCSNRHCLFTG